MARISNVDQMLMLLRQQLQRMSESNRSRRGSRISQNSVQPKKSAASRIEAMARAGAFTDEELARAMIGALLVDEFGEAAANDHKFQKLVHEVHRIIASDKASNTLLSEVLRKSIKPGENSPT